MRKTPLSARLRALALASALSACALPLQAQVATTCPSGFASTQLFPYTGAPATFTVPANVDTVRVIAVGADGGEIAGGFASGAGARAEGTFAVTQGQVFTVIAGQAPGGANDFEAGGGGASGAYLGTTLAVIAGGGGGDDNTGDGRSGTATNAGSNGGNPAGSTCNAGGLGGIGGAGGQFGEVSDGVQPATCDNGNGGGGGGGFNGPGGSSLAARGPRGGAQCSIAGAAGGAGGTADPTNADSIGAAGGYGVCGGGGADHREGGGGGGYSGGGGGPEGQYPGGGGSFVSASATTPTLLPGSATGAGGGSGRNGSVRLCWPGADVQVTKTNTFGAGPNDQANDTVTPGSVQTYTLVVTNNGPAPANGAVIRDPAPVGLTCSAVACSNPTGGAACAFTPALTVANLQSAGGVAINTLPSGGSVRLDLTCTVQ